VRDGGWGEAAGGGRVIFESTGHRAAFFFSSTPATNYFWAFPAAFLKAPATRHPPPPPICTIYINNGYFNINKTNVFIYIDADYQTQNR